MALDDIVRNLVGVAQSLTSSLQSSVAHSAWTGRDDHGKPTYATAVTRPALIEHEQRLLRTATGEEAQQMAKVTFLQPIAANGASGRKEPIDPRDKIVLPDGRSGPILAVEGLVDPDTSSPYLYVVRLGG